MGNAGGAGVEWQALYEKTERQVEEALKYHQISSDCIKMQQELIRTLAAENLHLRDSIARGTTASSENIVASPKLQPPLITACEVQGTNIAVHFKGPYKQGPPGRKLEIISCTADSTKGLSGTEASPAIVCGLTPGKEYRFLVACTEGECRSAWSQPSQAVSIPVQRPTQPVIQDVRVAGSVVELCFDQPREDRGGSTDTWRAYLYKRGRVGSVLAEGRTSPLCITGLKTGEEHRFVLVAVNGDIEGPESAPTNPIRLEPPTRICVDCKKDMRLSTESFIQERVRAANPAASLVFTPAAEADVVFVTCEIRDRIPVDLGQRIARHAGKRVGILMIHIMSSAPAYRQEVSVEGHLRRGNPVFDLVTVDGVWYTQTQKDAIRELVEFICARK